jgi:predicted DNA-binding transcriptional regulator AlpA
MQEQYFRVTDASKFLGVAKSTLWLFSRQGKIKPIKLSDRVTVWALSDLELFISSRMAV